MASVGSSEHLDMTAELDLDIVKQRSIKGVVTLTGRTFILQAITLISTFLLTIFLNPEEYGIFFVVSAAVNFFAYFSDIGLSAALIQKKEKLSEEELKTTFTIQQLLVLALVVLIFTLTSVFQNLYGLNQPSVYLLWALAISLFFSSLKTIPSVILERKLDFNKLIIPQIAESLLYNIVAVTLAWTGWGITSLTIAVLVRGVVGLILIYLLQPWMPGLSFAKNSLKGLLKFGLPYQINSFLAVIKDDGMTAVLGIILGTGNIGLLGWAQKWGTAPLRFFMDQVIKVTFPAFSRMQDDKRELSYALTRSIFFISLLVFPFLMGLVIVAPILTKIIPKYGKWEPALLALGLISINSAWAAVTTPMTNFLNAIGKISLTFKLMIMWTVLTWLLLPILAYFYGINGAGVGYAILGFSSIVALVVATRYITVDFIESVGKPLLATAVMGAVLIVIRSVVPVSFVGVLILSLIGVAVYTAIIFIAGGQSLVRDIKRIYISFKTQNS